MSFRTFDHPLTASVIALLTGYAAVGCASHPPPPELLDARAAYIRVESGPTSQLKPDRVHEAKVALDKAERAYEDDPGGQETRDIAYLALRDAERAEVEARDAKAAQEKVRGKADRQLDPGSAFADTRAAGVGVRPLEWRAHDARSSGKARQ